MQRLADVTDAPSAWRRLGALAAGRPGRLALDIGANTGQASRLLAPHYDRVICFEPAAESATVLEADHPTNVEVRAVAVSGLPGLVLLDIATAAINTGQLVDATALAGHLEWGDVIGWREVPATTIDKVVGMGGILPDLVKVDVEGHELEVMSGARNTVNLGYTTWFVEVHRADHERVIIEDWGGLYDVERIDHDYLRDDPRAADHFYLVATPV